MYLFWAYLALIDYSLHIWKILISIYEFNEFPDCNSTSIYCPLHFWGKKLYYLIIIRILCPLLRLLNHSFLSLLYCAKEHHQTMTINGPGMDGHDKTQVTREPTTVALHSCPRAPLMPDACSSPNSQSPYFRFLGCRRAAGAPPAESLTCSAAWRRPVAHLHRILEHPFFSATAASALTSPGGGAHTATWWPRGKEGRVGRPWKWGGSGREAPLWPPFWAVCLMWAAGLDLHELWETNSTQKGRPKWFQAPRR